MRRLTALTLAMLTLIAAGGCSRSQERQVAAPAVQTVTDAAPANSAAMTQPAGPSALPSLAIKADSRRLYPAYVWEQGQMKWGYVDPTGKFAIAPAFESAGDFERDGLAIVKQQGKYGLISKDGKLVVAPAYTWINPATADGVRSAEVGDGNGEQLFDATGKLVFDPHAYVGQSKDGLALFLQTVGGETRYGYVNRAGEVVIALQYAGANDFAGGQALVKLSEGHFAVIDTSGKQIAALDGEGLRDLSEGYLVFQDKATRKFGYMTVDGQIAVPASFGGARPFAGGFAVVGVAENLGLINTHGDFVLKPEYASLRGLGAGLYAAGKKGTNGAPEPYQRKAIFSQEGRQLTDFLYYDVEDVDQGFICVSDMTSTYFLDTNGRPAANLPTVKGIGTLKIQGDLIKADIDGRVSYLSRDGIVIWQGADTWALGGGIQVTEHKYRPGRSQLVFYPELSGMADRNAQQALNDKLKTIFLGQESKEPSNGDLASVSTLGFTVEQVKDLLVLRMSGNWYGVGAAHGMPIRAYYHIDSRTGAQYQLSDLFKPGAPYTERLQAQVLKQMAGHEKEYLNQHPAVAPKQSFFVTADTLTIYYEPYAIAAYAMGFREFAIPFAEISDLINTDGAFWKSFH